MATILREPLVSYPLRKRPIAPVDYFSRPLTLGINPNANVAQLSDSAPRRRRRTLLDVYPNLLGTTLGAVAPATLDLPLRSGRVFDSAPRKRWQADSLQSQGLIVYDGPEAAIASLTDSAPRRRKAISVDQYVRSLVLLSSNQYTLALVQGSYALSGQALALRAMRTLGLAQGAYALSGQSVALVLGHKLPIAQGSYSLNGQAVGLAYSGGARVITIGQGSYALTGQAVALVYGHQIALAQGAYTLSGLSVALTYGHNIAMGQGSYALTGTAAALRATRILALVQGSYALTGRDVTLTQHSPNSRLTLDTGFYTLTGRQVGLIGPAGTNTEFQRNLPLNWWTK